MIEEEKVVRGVENNLRGVVDDRRENDIEEGRWRGSNNKLVS